jgi:hypothetical protein
MRTVGTGFGNGKRPACTIRLTGKADGGWQQQWRLELNLGGQPVR